MAGSSGVMVKIDGTPELVSELTQIVKENPETMKLEYSGPSEPNSDLRLSLAEVNTIIAIVNGVITLGKFAHTIYKHFKDNQAQRLTLKTPLRSIEILSSDATSEEHVLGLLRSSLSI
jgi:hypothetical protein